MASSVSVTPKRKRKHDVLPPNLRESLYAILSKCDLETTTFTQVGYQCLPSTKLHTLIVTCTSALSLDCRHAGPGAPQIAPVAPGAGGRLLDKKQGAQDVGILMF